MRNLSQNAGGILQISYCDKSLSGFLLLLSGVSLLLLAAAPSVQNPAVVEASEKSCDALRTLGVKPEDSLKVLLWWTFTPLDSRQFMTKLTFRRIIAALRWCEDQNAQNHSTAKSMLRNLPVFDFCQLEQLFQKPDHIWLVLAPPPSAAFWRHLLNFQGDTLHPKGKLHFHHNFDRMHCGCEQFVPRAGDSSLTRPQNCLNMKSICQTTSYVVSWLKSDESRKHSISQTGSSGGFLWHLESSHSIHHTSCVYSSNSIAGQCHWLYTIPLNQSSRVIPVCVFHEQDLFECQGRFSVNVFTFTVELNTHRPTSGICSSGSVAQCGPGGDADLHRPLGVQLSSAASRPPPTTQSPVFVFDEDLKDRVGSLVWVKQNLLRETESEAGWSYDQVISTFHTFPDFIRHRPIYFHFISQLKTNYVW